MPQTPSSKSGKIDFFGRLRLYGHGYGCVLNSDLRARYYFVEALAAYYGVYLTRLNNFASQGFALKALPGPEGPQTVDFAVTVTVTLRLPLRFYSHFRARFVALVRLKLIKTH